MKAPRHEDVWGGDADFDAFITTALERCEWWLQPPATLPPPSLLSVGYRGLFPPVSIAQKNVWAPKPVWTFWKIENSLTPTENQTRILMRPAGSPVAVLTDLFRPISFLNNLLFTMRN
jgi:hypothetical protein